MELEGHWQMIRAELAGEAAPGMVAERTTLELRSGEYIVRFAEQVTDRGTYAAGATEAHRTLLLQGAAGPNAGRSIPCLFQLRGDLLRVCYGLDGVAPTEFAAPAGGRCYLATYRRVP